MLIQLNTPWMGHSEGSQLVVAGQMGYRLAHQGTAVILDPSDYARVGKVTRTETISSDEEENDEDDTETETETETGTEPEFAPKPEVAEATKEVARVAGARSSK